MENGVDILFSVISNMGIESIFELAQMKAFLSKTG